MKQFVNQLRPGDEVQSAFLVTDFAAAVKNGPVRFNLRDKTGMVKAISWDRDLRPGGGVMDVTGKVQLFNDALQVDVTRVSTPLQDVNPADFEAVAVKSIGNLISWRSNLREEITDPWLSQLVNTVYDRLNYSVPEGQMFGIVPAARIIHHATRHGLLQHSLEVAELAKGMAESYRDFGYTNEETKPPDISLVIVGALLHDCGKCVELQRQPGVVAAYEFGVSGGLLGHIVSGLQIVSEEIAKTDGFPAELAAQLLHIIASHHGSNENGSPVAPATPEAYIVHLADLASARLYIMHEARLNGSGLFAKTITGFAYRGEQAEEATEDDVPPESSNARSFAQGILYSPQKPRPRL